MKKRIVGFIWALGGCLALWAGEPARVELKGIVQFPKNGLSTSPAGQAGSRGSVVALIESQPTTPQNAEQISLLEAGQREGDLEVLRIDVATGTVQVKIKGETRELSFSALTLPKRARPYPAGKDAVPDSFGRIWLEGVSWREALGIYQRLVGRTLLISSAIAQQARITLGTEEPVTGEELAKAIEKSLDGLVFHPDGEKFTVVGREGDLEKLTPELRELARKLTTKTPRPPGAVVTQGDKSEPAEEIVPAGILNFQNTDLSQVLMVFQELVNRTLLRPALFPGSGIFLRTETPLTRGEATYAFCAVLALDGVLFEDLGDKFLFAYPSSEEAKRKALFARKLPPHAAPPSSETMPPVMGNAWFDLSAIAKVYGQLSGQPVELEQNLPRLHFVFREQTPLTTAEKLYALDMLLGWEGLQVVKQNDGGLRLMRVDK